MDNKHPQHHCLTAIVSVLALISLPTFVHAQTRSEGPWWPHPIWGAEDQAGGSNWITPEKIVESMKLVKTGKTYELGHVYERGMPMVGERSYNIFIPSFPSSGPWEHDGEQVVFNDEFIAAEIGQVGTQFDGPGHVGMVVEMADGYEQYVFYNGYTGDEMRNPYGLLKLGVEHVKPILTRGILLDLAGYKNTDVVADGYEMTLDDVHGVLKKQGLSVNDITAGDALLFNFGWWRRWPDPVMTNGNRPYISDEVIQWVIDSKACMVGSDLNLDGPNGKVHTEIVMKNGIFNFEFMTFEGLAKDQAYEFLFVFTPLRLKGATGSPGRPIAIR